MAIAPSRPLAWMLLLVMGWAGVWCCCTPAAAGRTQRPAHRSCCDAEATPATHATGAACPRQTPSDECPILKLRQASVAPVPGAVVIAPPVLVALSAWPAVPAVLHPTGLAFLPLATAGPPPGSATLLSLHTALRC